MTSSIAIAVAGFVVGVVAGWLLAGAASAAAWRARPAHFDGTRVVPGDPRAQDRFTYGRRR
jgi:hypothetical protein